MGIARLKQGVREVLRNRNPLTTWYVLAQVEEFLDGISKEEERMNLYEAIEDYVGKNLDEEGRWVGSAEGIVEAIKPILKDMINKATDLRGPKQSPPSGQESLPGATG
jgi:hypothetical protein